MKFNGQLSYLFHTDNNSGLIKNNIYQVYNGECTILCRFKPDLDAMIDSLPEETGYISTGIVCKNGKHIGIFFKIFRNYVGTAKWVCRFSFEFWEKGELEQKTVDVDFTEDDFDGKWFDIEFYQSDKEFTLTVNGKSETREYFNLVDYTHSYLWIGCANRLALDWKHELLGEIDKLAIDLEPVIPFKKDLFFNDFNAYIDNILRSKNSKAVFVSNLKKTTYYKIHDDSGNGNHPIKYDEEWVQ